MKLLLVVFFGSGMGGVVRYLLSKAVNPNGVYAFPLHTFVINFLACLLLGCLFGLGDRLSFNVRVLLVAGFCGGFSTFSAFSGETLLLLQQGQFFQATLYICLSVVVCIAATGIGMWITD